MSPPRREPAVTRFGEKLRALRVRRGMTLKELAGELGMSAHGYVSEIERGKKTPTVELVLKVADLFGVSTDELLWDSVQVRARREAGGRRKR